MTNFAVSNILFMNKQRSATSNTGRSPSPQGWQISVSHTHLWHGNGQHNQQSAHSTTLYAWSSEFKLLPPSETS